MHDLFSNYNGQMPKTLPEVLWEITGGFAGCSTGTWLRENFTSGMYTERTALLLALLQVSGKEERKQREH